MKFTTILVSAVLADSDSDSNYKNKINKSASGKPLLNIGLDRLLDLNVDLFNKKGLNPKVDLELFPSSKPQNPPQPAGFVYLPEYGVGVPEDYAKQKGLIPTEAPLLNLDLDKILKLDADLINSQNGLNPKVNLELLPKDGAGNNLLSGLGLQNLLGNNLGNLGNNNLLDLNLDNLLNLGVDLGLNNGLNPNVNLELFPKNGSGFDASQLTRPAVKPEGAFPDGVKLEKVPCPCSDQPVYQFVIDSPKPVEEVSTSGIPPSQAVPIPMPLPNVDANINVNDIIKPETRPAFPNNIVEQQEQPAIGEVANIGEGEAPAQQGGKKPAKKCKKKGEAVVLLGDHYYGDHHHYNYSFIDVSDIFASEC